MCAEQDCLPAEDTVSRRQNLRTFLSSLLRLPAPGSLIGEARGGSGRALLTALATSLIRGWCVCKTLQFEKRFKLWRGWRTLHGHLGSAARRRAAPRLMGKAKKEEESPEASGGVNGGVQPACDFYFVYQLGSAFTVAV